MRNRDPGAPRPLPPDQGAELGRSGAGEARGDRLRQERASEEPWEQEPLASSRLGSEPSTMAPPGGRCCSFGAGLSGPPSPGPLGLAPPAALTSSPEPFWQAPRLRAPLWEDSAPAWSAAIGASFPPPIPQPDCTGPGLSAPTLHCPAHAPAGSWLGLELPDAPLLPKHTQGRGPAPGGDSVPALGDVYNPEVIPPTFADTGWAESPASPGDPEGCPQGAQGCRPQRPPGET